MKVRGVDFVAVGIPAGRMKEAHAFYGGKLGLSTDDPQGEEWAEYDTGNLTIALVKEDNPHVGSTVTLALAVDDVGQAVDDLKAQGIEVTFGPEEYSPCFMAALKDPFGNAIYIHQRKDGTVG